jgi:ABC-type molybdate transport system permease subunit
LSVGVQTGVLLLANAAGYYLRPFKITQSFSSSSIVTLADGRYVHTQTFTFLWDGAIVMAAVYALMLMVEAVRGRMPAAAVESTVALALAGVIGLWDGLEYLAEAVLRR